MYKTLEIKGQSLLDMVFTSHPEAIESITHLAPLGCSDHDLCYNQPVLQNTTTYSWNYSKGDYEAFNNYFQQLDWSKLFNDDVEHNWSVLKEHIFISQELFIPQFIPSQKDLQATLLTNIYLMTYLHPLAFVTTAFSYSSGTQVTAGSKQTLKSAWVWAWICYLLTYMVRCFFVSILTSSTVVQLTLMPPYTAPLSLLLSPPVLHELGWLLLLERLLRMRNIWQLWRRWGQISSWGNFLEFGHQFALKTLQIIADCTIPCSGVPPKVTRNNLLQQLYVQLSTNNAFDIALFRAQMMMKIPLFPNSSPL